LVSSPHNKIVSFDQSPSRNPDPSLICSLFRR
jgi:hypothetical protein